MNIASIRTALIAAAIFAIGAFALFSIGGATAQQACIQPLSGNGTYNGTWDNTCLSDNTPLGDYSFPMGTRYGRFYTFTLSAPSTVTIELYSNADTYLYLMQGTGKAGTVLHYNDDITRNENPNSRILQSLTAGDYTIEATTYDVETTGSFTLAVSGFPDAATPTITPTLGAGDTPTATSTPIPGQATPTYMPTRTATPTITPTPTQPPAPDNILNRLTTLETRAATQQGLIATMESKITALDSRVATLEAGALTPTQTPVSGQATPTPEPTQTPMPTNTPTPIPGNLGTRSNPVPLGQNFRPPSSPWELKVVSVDWDAWPEIQAEDSIFEDHPPDPGNRYVSVRITVRNRGSSPQNFNPFILNRLGTIGTSLIARHWIDGSASCKYGMPDNFEGNLDMFPGGELEGNVCFEVLSSDLDSLILYGDYRYLNLSDRTYINDLWFWSLR